MRLWGLVGVIGVVALAPMTAPAQSGSSRDPSESRGSDPGQLQQQREREERYYEGEDETDSPDPGLDELPSGSQQGLPEEGQSFRLKGVRFDESAFISEKRLQSLAEPYVGAVVTFSQINDLVDEINAIYRDRGHVAARAVVPPQEIDDGILRVRLIEGEAGDVEIEGRRYTDEAFLLENVDVPSGEALDIPALRRRLRTFNRMTNLQLGAQLQAGDEFGTSNVRLGVNEPSRYRATVFADTNGSESTGEQQAGVRGVWSGPFRRGDQWSLSGVRSEGADSLSTRYSLPLGRRLGQINISLAYSETEVVEGPFERLDITGESVQAGVEHLIPGWTFADWSLDGLVRAGWVESTSDVGDQTLTDTAVRRLGIGFQGRGGLWGSRWFLRQEALHGRTTSDIEGGLEASYVRWRGRGVLTGPAFWGATYRVNASWQYSGDERLGSPDEFQIGGVGTVRGYENGVLTGARGAAVSAELHWRTPWISDVFVFSDVGHVNGRSPDSETIESLGGGLRYQYGRLRADLSAAQTMDEVTPDQDDYRVHLRIAYTFDSDN
jgi:hemolysin activation/secretion protein